MSIQSCPVVHPTWEQFNDFLAYTEYLEKTYSNNYGMVKVVPPEGWKACENDYSHVDYINIPGAIQQNAFGKGGFYECSHISHKPMSVKEFRKKTKDFEHLTDKMSDTQIEKLFWKSLPFSSPLYAADIQRSLMDEQSGSWNLNSLDSVLSQGMKFSLPGVTTPYLYFGSWKSFFCWHTEDMQLAAINFLHAGKTKFWYAVQRDDRNILQKQARFQFPQKFQKCSQHMRHKTTCMDPYKLKTKYPSFKIHKSTQGPGQFIIAFSGSYHCGFNSGFNIAQAVNYAGYSWLKFLPQAKYCKCRKDSVRISPKGLSQYLIESKLNNVSQVIQFYNQINDIDKKQSTRDDSNPRNKMQSIEEIQVISSDSQDTYQKDKQTILAAVRTKKIKVDSLIIQKATKKIVLKGEQFKIQSWAECEHCNKWRKINFRLKKSAEFTCKMTGMTCSYKQEDVGEYISLPQLS